MNISFVILHYLTEEDTITCIESIEALDGGDTATIIVVDNFSNNGSIEKVARAIVKYGNCKILYNCSNAGFAVGNNVGYMYARKKNINSFIVVLNNDIIIKQKDFITRIFDAYKESPYAVLGPDIISLLDGGHQNPMGKLPLVKAVKKEVVKYSILLFLSKINVYEFFQKYFGANGKGKKIVTEKPQSMVMNHCAVHGSCLIFSPEFVKVMEEAFCPETFLYKEEFILAKRCERAGLKIVFDSDIEVYHKEDSSTNRSVNSAKEKREFQFKNLIQSCKVYLKTVKGTEML